MKVRFPESGRNGVENAPGRMDAGLVDADSPLDPATGIISPFEPLFYWAFEGVMDGDGTPIA